jgi:hypothetical protein
MRKISKRAAVIATTATLALGGGVAYAAWLVNGSGAATATSASTVASLTTDALTVSGGLYPGAVRNVQVVVRNSNEFPVEITNISDTGELTVNPSTPACASSNVFFTPTAYPDGVIVPATGGLAMQGTVSMRSDAPEACKGKAFGVNLAIAGKVGSGAA